MAVLTEQIDSSAVSIMPPFQVRLSGLCAALELPRAVA
jgi:hypothetical protein